MIEPTQVEALLDEALARPPAERAAFLDLACKGNRELRQEVERLLVAHPQADGFLDRPSFEETVAHSPHTEGSTIIGPYKLVEQIGEGGMGTVWLAQQAEPVKRVVALKLIKAGMDSKQIIARFEAERQALALMDHPNIARVLDAGTTSAGRPYFVMDLVKGVPITKYCDERRLTPRQRLELFIPVCQAVQHAHQKGIIHRDLKPSNVLVTLYDGRPVPKVIDFGVAKAAGQSLTDKTLVTGFGNIVGTLEYMSPEQAEFNQLDVDTRSDIYSLGVLLYELLAGSPPFTRKELEKAGMLEILRVIREQEPSKPSTKLSTAEGLPTLAANRGTEPAKLTRLVRGELDWIVMKALEKDRNRRYETANGLALDLQRYLADEPVAAGPPSAAYRIKKFVRRNKGPVLAGAALITLLVLGVMGTSIGLVWAMQAERAANAAAVAESEQRLRAEAAYKAEVEQRRRTRKAVDDMYTKVAKKWLAQQPRMEKVQQEFLEKALQYYQEFTNEESNDPAVQFEMATAYHRIGGLYQQLGVNDKAEAAHRQAMAILNKLTADDPANREFRQELGDNHSNLGILQLYTNRVNEAEESFSQALTIYEQMTVDFGADAELRSSVASAHHHLGIVHSGMLGGTPRPEEAIKAFRTAAEVYREATTAAPDVAEYQSSLGGTLNDWAITLLREGDASAASPLVKEAIEWQRSALKLEPRRRGFRQFLINHLVMWSDIAEQLGQHDDAVKTAREALNLQEGLADEFPDTPHYRHAVAEFAHHLGQLLDSENARDAEAAFRQSISILESLADTFTDVPARRQQLAISYGNLGLLLESVNRPDEALECFRQALKWGPDNTSILDALGRSLLSQGSYETAEPVCRQLLTLREQNEPDSWTTYDAMSILGDCLLGQNKHADAEPLLLAGYDGMIQREEIIPAESRVRLTEAVQRLVRLYEAWDRPEQAAQWGKKLPAESPAKKD